MNNKNRRKRRVRAKIFGTIERPRLSVFRSSKNIYAQLIDDTSGKTLASATNGKDTAQKGMSGKVLSAYNTGILIAEKAKEQKIEKVIFDRGSYRYHGRVKALADGAKKGGLKF